MQVVCVCVYVCVCVCGWMDGWLSMWEAQSKHFGRMPTLVQHTSPARLVKFLDDDVHDQSAHL